MSASGRMAAVTMTRARNGAEYSLLLPALQVLDRFGLPIFIADAGSTAEFLSALSGLKNAQIASEGTTLATQVQGALWRALRGGFETLIYAEPDKKLFFETGFSGLVRAAENAPQAIVIPQRSEEGFSTFPFGQRSTEAAFNRLAADLLSIAPMDWLYGPLAIPAAAIQDCVEEIPPDVGWGWRPFLISRWIAAQGLVVQHEGTFACPEDQRGEDDPESRVYRLEQLRQNIEGLKLGLRTARSAD